MKIRPFILITVLILLCAFLIWVKEPNFISLEDPEISEEPAVFEVPLGLPPIPWPKDNPYNQKKVELGRLLYFDKRLSSNGTVSCSSCHAIPRAYGGIPRIAIGIEGREGIRNSPTIINSAYQTSLFWDGRAKTLEEQAKGPIGNPNEMALTDNVHDAHTQCEKRVKEIKGYRLLFKQVFGDEECSMDNIAKAIATFERTVVSGNAPYDRYKAGDKSAMTQEQIDGFQVFKRVGCANCHSGPNFSDGRFLNIGVGMEAEHPDLGRYVITKNEKDWGAFKVPILRDVSKSYPYMHDGSLATLEDVIDYYDKGGIPNRNLHPSMQPLHLSNKDKHNLIEFMKALDGEGWQHFTEPQVFPQKD